MYVTRARIEWSLRNRRHLDDSVNINIGKNWMFRRDPGSALHEFFFCTFCNFQGLKVVLMYMRSADMYVLSVYTLHGVARPSRNSWITL